MNNATHSRLSTRLGQWFFSTMSHNVYDIGLYQFITPYIWRCPTPVLIDHYATNLSNNHLEIGVGSGFLLEHALLNAHHHRLSLLDLNQRCLLKSAARLHRFTPHLYHHDILEPLAPANPSYSSIGMNYVMHCIPGSFYSNQRIFHHIASQLEPGGVFFGATLIRQSINNGLFSWIFMRVLAATGIFNNALHSSSELQDAMRTEFSEVAISMIGNSAIFRAVK